MSEPLIVLESEPRHKIDEFVNEMLGRARLVIAEMGLTLERLLQDMIGQFRTFQEQHYLITLKDVRFDYVRWTRGGQLVIEFSLGRKPPKPEQDPRHVVIDAFVEDVVGRTVPAELQDEFKQFLRGMVAQFAVLKKHSALNLRLLTFGSIRWLGARELVIEMLHDGKPFTPRSARWE